MNAPFSDVLYYMSVLQIVSQQDVDRDFWERWESRT